MRRFNDTKKQIKEGEQKMKHSFSKKFLSVFLCIALIMTYLPISVMAASTANGGEIVTDPGTADAWEYIMGTTADGNRYAGRVWVDKSVYKDGDAVTLNRKGDENSTFTVDVDEENGEYFQVVFSALGSSMSTNTQTYAARPLDVVLVLDTSTSMATVSSGRTRFKHMIDAANELLEELVALGDVRIAIVSFNADSETIIDLDNYNNGIVLSVNDDEWNYWYPSATAGNGVITARDKSGALLGNDSGYTNGTNLQDGINRGMNILANAENTEGRAPVAIVLADGRANRAVDEDWYAPVSSNIGDSDDDAAIMLSTLLNAAYGRTVAQNNYDADMTVYGIGIDLSPTTDDYIFLNPGAEGSDGFNASNTATSVQSAWNAFTTWRRGTTATITYGNGRNQRIWSFDHDWPTSAGVTTAEIAANINYVDDYQNADSAELGEAFDEILQELSTGAFNPITDTNNGATGVEDTPLIYVDNIGQYMEVKNIQALQVFGNTYNITKNANGTYSVAAGNGVNPTTNENWNTANDIRISVNQNADGTEQLRVYINQEILPILLDEITVTTENGVTTRTLEELSYPPLRIYYTVGIDEDILLPNGEVNPLKLDSDYAYLNADGTADFYSNAFGVLNTTNADGDTFVDEGDAHVGFVPSHDNRYYYHQAHQEIFIDATQINGDPIDWDDDMYGVPWDATKYDLTAMTYADLGTIQDSDRVYTYVTFTRPTGNGIEAEEVTYLVYTTWGALKSAVTFHDKVNDANLNGGEAIDVNQVDTVVNSYLNGNSGVNTDDLIAVLGMKSRRVSRLSNMFETKSDNITGTAETSYAPEYNDGAHSEDDMHEHSEVIVWLGNNGKLTLPVASGIKITKDLPRAADGASADEVFTLYVRLDMDTQDAGNLFIADVSGNALATNKYAVSADGNAVLVTLYLADNESAVIMGAPDGTDFSVTEAEHDKYKYRYDGAATTVAGEIVEGIVTNSPILPGTLFITKEVEHAYGGEVFPKDYEFDFEVTFVDKNGQPIANTEFDLENNYDSNLTKLSTDADGIMRGNLRHGETVNIFGIPAGATVTVEEVDIPANYTKTEYRSRNHSGADADNDGVVTIDAGQNATVVVTNTYTPDDVSVDISFNGTKNFDAREIDSDSVFTFKLQEYKNGQWADVEEEGKTKTVTVVKGENASESFAFSPLELEFSEPGVHSYQIIEVKGTDGDITYDRSVYTFSVNVVIDDNGDLQAEVVGHNEGDTFDVSVDNENGYVVDTTFNNYYHKTATSIEIKKSVIDNANSGKTAAGFVIETYNATVDNGTWTIGSKIRETVTDAQGEALLVRNYDNTDFEGVAGNTVTYHFIIKEKDTEIKGWTYDATEYRVTVVLTKAADESISADFNIVKMVGGQATALGISGNTATISFANVYEPNEAEVDLNVTPTVLKDLEGRALTAGEFTFAIFNDGEAEFDTNGMLTNIGDAIATGTNDTQGNVTFAPVSLSFSQVGKYEYDVIEVKGSLGGVSYDSTIYDLVVEVSDDGSGTLKAEHYFEDSVTKQVVFHNTYTVEPASAVINGIKNLKVNSGNKTLHAGDYTFGLYNASGEKIAETTNLADGTFNFGAIEYDTDDIGKTYTYTVKEIAPDGTTDGSYHSGGVTWSGQSFEVTVNITDNGNGTITPNVTGNGAGIIEFVNEYDSIPVSIQLDGKKNLQNRPLTAGEFTFTLYSTDRMFGTLAPIDDDITHDIDGEFNVDLGTLQEGRHYFLLKENIPNVHEKGIHYSVAEYHITIVVTDHGTGKMSYTKMVVNANIPNVTDAAIEFTNVYIPEPGELPLSGTKTYNGGKALEDDVFSVGLYDSDAVLLQTAPIKADGTFVFENLRYHAADVGNTYTYTIKEIIPDGAINNGDGTYTLGNNIYDGSVYTLTVSIADDPQDGELEIDPVLTKGASTVNEITFTNTFVPNPITHIIEAKKTYEKGLNGDDFEFTLVSADNKTNVDQSKKNDANGDITFDAITFSEAGSYKFTVTEIGKILGFIRYSAAEYEVTITVVNENGVLRVSDVDIVNTENTDEADLEFVNVYVMDGEDEITLRGTKVLTGDRTRVNANEFEFGLYDAAGVLVESVKNDANGNFVFTTLPFDETDVPVNGSKQITYTIQEIAGNNARYTYDDTIYTVVITVKDNDQGGVTATYTVNGTPSDNAEITFTNGYTNPAPVTYTPLAQKNYNKTLSGGEFKFKLEGNIGNTPVSQEKTNAEGGTITFDTLSFPEAGTYTFTVTEIEKLLGFIQYSATEYELVVTIVDTNGALSLGSVTVNNDPNGTIEFTNTYVIDGEDEITLRGNKALTGGRTSVNAGEFEFGLYDANGELIESVKNDADGNFAFTTLKFDETDVPVSGQKQIAYIVKEIKGTDIRVTYDETVYTVVVTVKDNEQGGVTASYTVNSDATGLIAFTNIYTPKPEDITVDLDIVKTVVNKGSEKIGPEGFEFLLNALADGVADVTVKADENGKAKFTLTFTEDDIGKTYTYKLTEVNGGKANVTYSNAEYTITVAIELNENNELEAHLTKNGENATEVVAEFENVYDYTPTPEYPDSPQTGDNTNLHLWFALLFVSGGGIFGTALYGRKRKEEEAN